MDGIKRDPVEKTEEYKQAMEIIMPIINNELGNSVYLGKCHRVWYLKKGLLMELFGIYWKSPAELNPDIDFE